MSAPLVILPDDVASLLRRELSFAFTELGFVVRCVRPEALLDSGSADYLPKLLDLRPALFFSVNLQGLLPVKTSTPGNPNRQLMPASSATPTVQEQPGGLLRPDIHEQRSESAAKLLLESGTPVLVWFVDNPWHVLSGMREPAWKKFTLAVTDANFIDPLQAALEPGHKVLHMPLAACPYCLERSRDYTLKSYEAFPIKAMGEVVFAGRSYFPGKQAFFAGLQVPPELLAEASAMFSMSANERPDFAWWVEKLGLGAEQAYFWPGKKSRLPGLGAAESNRLWRAACLSALLQSGPDSLTLFGDEGWREDLSAAACLAENHAGERGRAHSTCVNSGSDSKLPDLRPPFDYYARLHAVYSKASFSLNLNSLLLPAGLTQRAFDIWAAGGFCLSDASPGLNIFPPELAAPVSFNTPSELLELRNGFRADPAKKEQLRRAWQAHILAKHTYAQRLRGVLGKLGLV